MPVAPELLDRFRADLFTLRPQLKAGADKLGIALSGGGDSLALLLLAKGALPGRVEAATVDHQLREGSAEEAELASRYCAQIDVPHRILKVKVPGGNLQSQARAARYRVLAAWCEERGLSGLATAHQLDDQAETFFMRLNRGSGLGGLASIRALSNVPETSISLVRPLLAWKREELARIVKTSGWEAIQDPSNSNTDFDRVRMRENLARCDWIDLDALGRSAQHLAAADAIIRDLIHREFSDHVNFDGEEARYSIQQNGAAASLIQGGVIRSIFGLFGLQVNQRVGSGLAANLSRELKTNIGGLQAEVRNRGGETVWTFRRENTRRTS
ncbi:tRNA lysidine(34) synthetase TilS [Qipengyuania sp. NPDC077563]|uniref:tRNA lysidine(34) synthetase TilS n=1 Tax=Qipengyuania sp. NPDC077563 TaxID=3364497 RepID=UPI003850C08E